MFFKDFSVTVRVADATKQLFELILVLVLVVVLPQQATQLIWSNQGRNTDTKPSIHHKFTDTFSKMDSMVTGISSHKTSF